MSISYFLESYELLSNQFPNSKYCYELVKIGENYLKLNKLEEAKQYYLTALERSKDILNKDTKVSVLVRK